MDQLAMAVEDEVEQASGAAVLLKYLLNPAKERSGELRCLNNLYAYFSAGIQGDDLATGRNLQRKKTLTTCLARSLVVSWKPARKIMKNKRKGHTAQGQMKQKAKLDSASEITSPHDALQLDLKGSCRAVGSIAILSVCTYNIWTLWTEDNLDRLIDEVDQIKWDVSGLCKTYRKGERLSEIKGGYCMYEIRKTEDNPDAKGLTFQVHPEIKDCVTDVKTCSNWVNKMKVNLLGKDSVTVINAYTPTPSAKDEKMG